MPGPSDSSEVVKAVRSGELKEEVLDQAVERILSVYKKLEFGQSNCEIEKLYEESTKVAYQAALEGIVLLRNESVLPLSKDAKVAIVGSAAEALMECGTGSAGITTNRTSSLKECLAPVQVLELNEEIDAFICICKVPGMEGNDRKDLFLSKEDQETIDTCIKDYPTKRKYWF